MSLDSTSILFQNLNDASDDVKLEMNADGSGTYFVSHFLFVNMNLGAQERW